MIELCSWDSSEKINDPPKNEFVEILSKKSSSDGCISKCNIKGDEY